MKQGVIETKKRVGLRLELLCGTLQHQSEKAAPKM